MDGDVPGELMAERKAIQSLRLRSGLRQSGAHPSRKSAVWMGHPADRPSVVQIRLDDLDPFVICTPITKLLRQFRADLEAGALVTLDAKRTRVRMLPFRVTG